MYIRRQKSNSTHEIPLLNPPPLKISSSLLISVSCSSVIPYNLTYKSQGFLYWPRRNYLLVVDVRQDASQDLQQEDAQQQDKVLGRRRRRRKCN